MRLPLILFLVVCCCGYTQAQVFFSEPVNAASCREKGDLQFNFSTKLTHIYRLTGRQLNYNNEVVSTDMRLFNVYADAGYALTRHLMLTVSYMREKQDGNIYITGKATGRNNVGDRGRYTGNRLYLGSAYILPVKHMHSLTIHGNVYMGTVRRTPNADDYSQNRFTTSYAGFNLYPLYGIRNNVVEFSFGPRLNYQQYFNGKANAPDTVSANDLWTAGAVLNFSLGYRLLKFNMQTGFMGRLSHEDYYQGHRDVEHKGFYSTMGVHFYIDTHKSAGIPVR